MVSRLTLTLAIGSLFCCLGGCGRPDRRTRTAMALLSENEALSLRVAKERVASARPAGGARPTPAKEVTEGDGADTQSASPAARIAVCRETLAIVEELLEELGHRSKGELDNLLVEAATLQQSRCGASGYPHTPNRKGRDQGSTREQELHQVMRRLDTLLPLAEAELQELTRPYVPRLLAVVDTAKQLAVDDAEPKRDEPIKGPETANRKDGPERRGQPTDRSVPTADGRAGRQAEQMWSPSPEVLAERRRQREAEFLRQLAAWRPAYQREFGRLRSTRRALRSELAHSSLASSRAVCERLGEAVAGIDSGVARGSPDRSVNVQLRRALSAYVTAARECSRESFVVAYKEILEGDRWWLAADRRIRRLQAIASADPGG
jgi:hypothetical protein